MKQYIKNPTKFAFDEMIKSIFTAHVGHIVAFNPANQRAQVQIGVQRINIDDTRHNPPAVIDVPVLFLGGSHLVEFEVQPKDEGLIVFIQRNIDGWKQTGGIADNPTPRILSGQDAVFIHGVRSLPNAVSGFSNNGIRLRNKDGSSHIWIKNDGTIVSDNGNSTIEQSPNGDIVFKNEGITHDIKTDGSISITNGSGFITMDSSGTVTINGMVIPANGGQASYAGTLSATEVEASGISLTTHTHTGVQAGGDNTGEPQ